MTGRPPLSPHGTLHVKSTLPLPLVDEVDRLAEQEGTGRAGMIRRILTDALDWTDTPEGVPAP